MKTVFLLFHTHHTSDGAEDSKILGVYATYSDASSAQQRALLRPGFNEHADGFTIDKYDIGADHWQDGFRTVRAN